MGLTEPPHRADAADRLACRRLIRDGSRSFFTASLLLPPAIRDAAYALYGFCRLSDDLVDVDGIGPAAIERLRGRLDRAYAGRPDDHPVDRAFADMVASHALPRALPDALIDGLDWDVAGVECATLGDLYAYAARVAGSVGAMMTVLMGVRDPEIVARACDLGVAMQLTNIARDVGEDARAGRLYLPRDWLADAGIDADAWLRDPRFGPALAGVVERLLAAADRLYARAAGGIAGLPRACRPGILAASLIYREIGVVVAAHGYDSVTARARVRPARKLALLGQALAGSVTLTRDAGAQPLAETHYLVDAVAATRPLRVPARRLGERLIWAARLMADLEARERRLTGRA